MTARYLLRFDDLCPTMNWNAWAEIEAILSEYEVRPILAVIPDNQDSSLMVSEPNPNFWNEVRRWQSKGWTIGLHGYQHTYATQDSGIVGINGFSEFSGLPIEQQLDKLTHACEIFRLEGVVVDVWIAPAHSFDSTTLRVLKNLGIRHVSDGFFLYPGLDSLGMMWVPQQFWSFRAMPVGVLTVCWHFNRWTTNDFLQLRAILHRYRESIVDFQSVASAYEYRRRNVGDKIYAKLHCSLLKMRRWVHAQT